MRTRSPMALLAALAAAGLFLTGCDESEQGRTLHFEKGVYRGEPDSTIPGETLDELRQRARLQSGG